jgi:hypothetical protein
MDVLLQTYDIVHRVLAHIIQQERLFGPATIADWDELCRGYVGLCAEQLLTRPTKASSIGASTVGEGTQSEREVGARWC